MLARLCGDDKGSNAIEYGLIAALVSLALVVGAGVTGVAIGGIFTFMNNVVTTVMTGTA